MFVGFQFSISRSVLGQPTIIYNDVLVTQFRISFTDQQVCHSHEQLFTKKKNHLLTTCAYFEFLKTSLCYETILLKNPPMLTLWVKKIKIKKKREKTPNSLFLYIWLIKKNANFLMQNKYEFFILSIVWKLCSMYKANNNNNF